MAGAAAATAGAATGAAIPAAGDATAAAGAESVDFIIEHWFHPILLDSLASAFPFQGVSVLPMAEEQQLQARQQEQQQQEQLNEMRNLAA